MLRVSLVVEGGLLLGSVVAFQLLESLSAVSVTGGEVVGFDALGKVLVQRARRTDLLFELVHVQRDELRSIIQTEPD